MVISENTHSRRRALGAFYTPQGLTDIICKWAISSINDTVLEPSFGGCGFLRSANDRLLSLGSKSPNQNIYGCDIDVHAFEHLSLVFEKPVDLGRFYEGDFLDMPAQMQWPDQFSAVIGNPPYLPYQKIDSSQRERVRQTIKSMGLALDRRASIWAYFVALSVPLIATGGRMAWVLPSSFLYANYSSALRKFLVRNFEKTHAFELKERQFLQDGTEEKSIVLLAAEKRAVAESSEHIQGDIALTQCTGVRDLTSAMTGWQDKQRAAVARCGTSVLDNLSPKQRAAFAALSSNKACVDMGAIVDVRIGLVTGNNAFFVLGESDAKAHGLEIDELVPILPKFRFAPGLSFELADYSSLIHGGARGYLVTADNEKVAPKSIEAYLAKYAQKDIKACSTFKKRAHWCAVDDRRAPDCFLPVMHHLGPRIVNNTASMNCTNSVYRGYFKRRLTKTQTQLLSLSMLTTFSQISAEIEGRSYGSGALKHEPREAERIKLLLPKIHHRTINAAHGHVDRMLRAGHHSEARQFADVLLLNAIDKRAALGNLVLLRSGLEKLRMHRHR